MHHKEVQEFPFPSNAVARREEDLARNHHHLHAVKTKPAKQSFFKAISTKFIGSLESLFFWYGKLVATHPWTFIVLCLIGSGLFGFGLLYWKEEVRPEKLWIPDNSDFAKDSRWVEKNIPNEFRFEVAMLIGENVMTREGLLEMHRIYEKIAAIRVGNKTFEDVCARIPVHNRPTRRKRQVLQQERGKWRPPAFKRRLTTTQKPIVIPQSKPVLNRAPVANPQAVVPVKNLPVPNNNRRQQQRPTIPGNIYRADAATQQFVRTKLPQLALQDIPAPDLAALKERFANGGSIDASKSNFDTKVLLRGETTTTTTTTTNRPSTSLPVADFDATESERVEQFIKNTSGSSTRSVGGFTPFENFPFDRRKTHMRSEGLSAADLQKLSGLQNDPEGIGALLKSSGVDPSIFLPRDAYCPLAENVKTTCWTPSPLEMWNFDRDVIAQLTDEEIIKAFNEIRSSPVYGTKADYRSYLGGVEKDSDGRVIKAQAVRSLWIVRVNLTAITEEDRAIIAAASFVADNLTKWWESEFIKVLANHEVESENLQLFFQAFRSFVDITSESVLGDTLLLGVGYVIVYFYIIMVLGKCNQVEQRCFLSLIGLGSVGLSTMVSLGICHAIGILYGPMHKALPFILLGLGIDDMFVIAQCWQNLSKSEQNKSLEERVGRALQHAGAAITITSVTDVAAFIVGASTILPALRSFCIYAAIGMVSLYFYQSTFFVAWFTLDQRRIEERRNGFVFCYKHSKSWKSRSCFDRPVATICFEAFGNFLLKTPVKIVVIVLTTVVLAFNIWGFIQLRQEFDRVWFLPTSSYLFKYFENTKVFYPGHGEKGSIFFGKINYTAELDHIDSVVKGLRSHSDIIKEVRAWTDDFIPWVHDHNGNLIHDGPNHTLPSLQLSEDAFLEKISLFLFSPKGAQYRDQFKFNGTLTCKGPAPPILVSRVDYQHVWMKGPEQHVPAMHVVKRLAKNSGVSTGDGKVIAWARTYLNWETDEVIQIELYRNLGMALICVFFMTLLLIANAATSMMVFLCVGMTLVNMGGLMHWWGLTIDTVSSLSLILAIGLSVDYSAHVGHMFMTLTGTREERARATLTAIGPAVFHGGFSTFLAFSLLAGTDSHVFGTFFKVFFGVVMFGLYQGLCFLPVMLSLIGPAPYESAVSRHEIRALEHQRQNHDDDGHGHHPQKHTNHGVTLVKSNGHANHGFVMNDMNPGALVPLSKTDEHLIRLAKTGGILNGFRKDVDSSPWPMLTSLNNHINMRDSKEKNHEWPSHYSPKSSKWKSSPPHARMMGVRDQPDGCEGIPYGFGQHSGLYVAMEEAKMLNGLSNGTAYPAVTSRIALKSSPSGSPGLRKTSPKTGHSKKAALPVSNGIQNMLQHQSSAEEPLSSLASGKAGDHSPSGSSGTKRSPKASHHGKSSDSEDRKRQSGSSKPSPVESDAMASDDAQQPHSMPAEAARPDWGFTTRNPALQPYPAFMSLNRPSNRRHSPYTWARTLGGSNEWDSDPTSVTMPYIPPPDYTPPSRRASSQRFQASRGRLEPSDTSGDF